MDAADEAEQQMSSQLSSCCMLWTTCKSESLLVRVGAGQANICIKFARNFSSFQLSQQATSLSRARLRKALAGQSVVGIDGHLRATTSTIFFHQLNPVACCVLFLLDRKSNLCLLAEPSSWPVDDGRHRLRWPPTAIIWTEGINLH